MIVLLRIVLNKSKNFLICNYFRYLNEILAHLAVSGSFFKGMKAEELYRYKYKSEREFHKSVSDYIEYYNVKLFFYIF